MSPPTDDTADRPSRVPAAAIATALVLVAATLPVAAAENVVSVDRCYEAGHGWGGFDNATLYDTWPQGDPPRLFGDGGFLPQAHDGDPADTGAEPGCDSVVDVWGVRIRPGDLPDDAWGKSVEVKASIDDVSEPQVIGTVCSVVNEDEYCGNQDGEVLAPFCTSSDYVSVDAGWKYLGIIVGNVAHNNLDCRKGATSGGGSFGQVDVDVRIPE